MDFYISCVIAFVIGIISLWLLWRKRRMTLLQRYGLPGPKPNFWTGNLKEFEEKREKCFIDWLEKHGKLVGFYLGAKPFIMASDKEFLKTIQVKEFKNFANKDFILPDGGISHKSIMKAVDFLMDEEWKSSRSYLSMGFSTGKIKKMSHIITATIEIFLKKIKEEEQKTFDILKAFNNLNFDIICKAALGVSTDVQNNNTNLFIRSVQQVFNADASQILPALSVCFPEFEPIPTLLRRMIDRLRYIFNLTSVTHIIKTCEDIIESRRKTENPPSDFLQSMIDASTDEAETLNTDASEGTEGVSKSYTMSNDEVAGNALALVIAGFETMGTILGYCSHVLATYPEVQEKARTEIIKNFPLGEEIDYAGLTNLQYLDQVISETLRLYPLTLSMVNRVCAEDFKYKNITIPKGAVILVPTWNLQRDPAYWSEPEKFVPERFSSENRGSIDPIVYQPYGAGPRICLGIRFATTVMKFTLANLLRNYKLEKDDQEELEFEYSLLMVKPKNGVQLRAVPLK